MVQLHPNLLNVYRQNGFDSREDYLNSLREEYGSAAVKAATSFLPASEDFDGLVTELEDNADMFD